ncbi:NAD-dependent epimerase/dehydratase family protein [Marivita sp. GX14005]|uniref:NAD-dependent epimerase/dehydratase family protein n=1 Tax=Marivita sp. GX14005 TaxID=2942276 RepID=UPI0020189456|nr:NAD-dependent epimerase/dehydratase family protein [Marivita sp. GX14005]MCL3881772.1 NAD-dependent epimerase/dehydratase family protein [Marivita sp. GX14005]
MASSKMRVALIGAGYIADWHADALRATDGVEIAAVCDPSKPAAEGLSRRLGVPAFTDLGDLLDAGLCDAAHILTPPQLHHAITLRCLRAGLHVLVEKPVATSCSEAAEMLAAAEENGVRFHAGHNFMGLSAYRRLRSMLSQGDLGRVSSAEVHWCLPFAPLRSGPYGIWPLREPKNLLLELGPHLAGFVVDLFGPPEIEAVHLSKPVDLPGDDTRQQTWRIMAQAGGVDLTLTISTVEIIDDRSLTVRGSSGRARLDFAADTLTVERENASDLVLNPLRRRLDQSWQHLREGLRNTAVQTLSLNRKSPYAQSFRGMTQTIYQSLREGTPPDRRFSGESAVEVMDALDRILSHVPARDLQPARPKPETRNPKPTAMVIGGTGFIGRALTRALVAKGQDVRVLSRGASGPFPDLPDEVETVGVSLYDKSALADAMQGIDVVYNLARSLEGTWQDALEHDVGVAVRIAEACRSAGVKRLVYTGTIASYDMSDPRGRITEDTGFADDMSDRNLYARSKAECERRLLDMHRQEGLPLVIARPGIVVGPGGPLQHWGIGRWHGAGAVRIWGNGLNILPFVLIDDVAEGLILVGETPGIDGESYNLIGEPMLSARGYFDAIHTALGARIRVSPGNLTMFWAADAIKHQLKTRVLGRTGLSRPSLVDWKSRAHLSAFVNDKPKRELGWRPETDKSAFIEKAIGKANLFGF